MWYFSFGVGHVLGEYLISIEGTWESARERFISCFGTKFCGQYDWIDAERLIADYHYKVIEGRG